VTIGKHPVQRGVFWQRTEGHGLLYTNGFKPRIATYDGFEIPFSLSISFQHVDVWVAAGSKDTLLRWISSMPMRATQQNTKIVF
jgi:hypothetical protein